MISRHEQLDKALEALRARSLDPESAGGAVALQFLLGPQNESSGQASTQPSSGQTSPRPPVGEGEPLSALASWSGSDPLRLSDFFECGDATVRLTIPSGRLPRAKADQQRVLTLLTLAAHKVAFKAQQTSHREVNAVLHDYAAFDQNLGKNVAKNSNLIIRSGKSKAHFYRITQPGLDRARELVQALVTTEEVLPS